MNEVSSSSSHEPTCHRRTFLASALGLALPALIQAEDKNKVTLARQVGITTSSLSGHLVPRPKPGQFSLLDLPKIMRDELDMRVIDLNTRSLASLEPAYLDRCRDAAEKAGCVFTNLKLNQRNLDMNCKDKKVRDKALAEYKKCIDAAARLGARWARPLPRKETPVWEIHVAGYQELAKYAAPRKVRLLVENYGWMQADADIVPRLVKAIGHGAAACPDTGNWANDTVRYAGLAKAFPLAVSCDFKAFKLSPKGEHASYNLERCFRIGWDAGFRGPWCLEHANANKRTLFKELGMLRDGLRKWIGARG